MLSACSNAAKTSSGLPPLVANNFTTGAAKLAYRLKSASTAQALYVSDPGNHAIEILQGHPWGTVGTITSSLNEPQGLWLDKNRHLYAANFGNGSVTEYDPAGNLVFTYTAGAQASTSVTTDRFGNVYEGDWSGFVNEYQPHVNSVALTCSIGADTNIGGIAVDARGDVFVSNSDFPGHIIEFKHGLLNSHCTGTTLAVALLVPYGIALDSHNNLIVADVGGTIDIVAPPYTSISGTLGSGWNMPVCVTINKANTRAYVGDFGAKTVTILTYPGGATIQTLGSTNGLNTPYCGIDSKNYNP